MTDHGSHFRAHALRVALIALALLAFASLTPAQPAEANGVPVPVELSYIDLSNWGPQDATGLAELMFAEGIVRVSAEGLPPLTGQRYQGWLVNSEAGDAISVGRFNADATGRVDFQGTMPPIADFGFDLFILTVEPEPDDAPQPSPDRSIGGYFSLIGQPDADGSIEGGQGGSAAAPAELPNTGDALWTQDLLRFGALAGVMALSIFVGLRLGRRTA
jgi:hypothetical protein